ncbi:MAG: CRISPR-associated protein Cas4 [Bacteroidota bacterium]|nr:CRISPR-associated protein Cas4 [Bacteroidota bacterium]
MISITPSQIIEYLFCPRFTYFEYVLGIPQYENRHYKVEKGRQVHEQKQKRNTDYIRKRIGAKAKHIEQYLTNSFLRGQVDEVLELNDNTMAPLDYKFAKWDNKVYETYKTQLFCYALLIEENFGARVNKGFLVYTRSSNKLIEVEISDNDKILAKERAMQVIRIIEENFYPKATKSKARCLTCTYRNICTR